MEAGSTVEQIVDIERIEQLVNLFGNFDENIKRIEEEYSVTVTTHGSQLKVKGDTIGVSKAVRAINCLLVMLNKGENLSSQNIDCVINMVEDGEDCADVLIQLSAVKSEINNTGKLILKQHMEHCIVEAVRENDQTSIDKMNEAIDRFMK